jgi:hypothetical protein
MLDKMVYEVDRKKKGASSPVNIAYPVLAMISNLLIELLTHCGAIHVPKQHSTDAAWR